MMIERSRKEKISINWMILQVIVTVKLSLSLVPFQMILKLIIRRQLYNRQNPNQIWWEWEKIRTSPDECTNLLQTIIDSKRSIMSDHWVTILTINNNYFRYYYSANRMLIVDFVLQNFSLYDFEKKLKRVSL